MTFQDLLFAFQEILDAFAKDFSIWWVLTPIFLLWIFMELYFGEYKHEEFGFSSSLANGVSLLWISVTSLHIFFLDGPLVISLRFFLLFFFLCYGLFIIWAAFWHRFSEHVTGVIASPSIVYFFSTLSVLWSQRLLDITLSIGVALLFLFVLIFLTFFLIKRQMGFLGELETVKNIGKNNHD